MDNNDEKFIVKWPKEDGIRESNEKLVRNRRNGRLMKCILGVVAGGRFSCTDKDDAEFQIAYYEDIPPTWM